MRPPRCLFVSTFFIWTILPLDISYVMKVKSFKPNPTFYDFISLIFLGLKSSRRLKLSTSSPFKADCLENVGTATSHSPIGLHGLVYSPQ
jgi:hypothetical protein